MDYVRLGSAGLKVSRICLGMMSFGNPDPGHGSWRAWHALLSWRSGDRLPIVSISRVQHQDRALRASHSLLPWRSRDRHALIAIDTIHRDADNAWESLITLQALISRRPRNRLPIISIGRVQHQDRTRTSHRSLNTLRPRVTWRPR